MIGPDVQLAPKLWWTTNLVGAQGLRERLQYSLESCCSIAEVSMSLDGFVRRQSRGGVAAV